MASRETKKKKPRTPRKVTFAPVLITPPRTPEEEAALRRLDRDATAMNHVRVITSIMHMAQAAGDTNCVYRIGSNEDITKDVVGVIKLGMDARVTPQMSEFGTVLFIEWN